MFGQFVLGHAGEILGEFANHPIGEIFVEQLAERAQHRRRRDQHEVVKGPAPGFGAEPIDQRPGVAFADSLIIRSVRLGGMPGRPDALVNTTWTIAGAALLAVTQFRLVVLE